MISSTYLMIFGAIAVIIVGVVLWKWFKSPGTSNTIVVTPPFTSDKPLIEPNDISDTTDTSDTKDKSIYPPPPPMVFAVNDNSNLDLTDFNNKILDSSFGPNPKIYLGLLSQATKDITETKSEDGVSSFTSNVGNTKSYKVGDHSYIINYTRLT